MYIMRMVCVCNTYGMRMQYVWYAYSLLIFCVFYVYLFSRDDIVFNFEKLYISRADINELLSNSYLGNEHVDMFTLMLNEKCNHMPDKYHKLLYISPVHWNYKGREKLSRLHIDHITELTVTSNNILLQPIIESAHWTLLVGLLKEQR
ncbi:hypothetical protein IEQ34_011787 [Dendrobium chrysotoxum]|uniref:Ubiquitin-like protease family profile domain-containing protein n=1 Tax=Dendrobium chrysotoxum TaxID=161865 RepID=A0AAV7GTM2_DENCH|nr:hypothetical protein IEQ34_011787 [Dendrobium chrysotoxum]